jgi:excisionase family DNA binding protein
MAGDEPVRGTGPRLISVAEAARILRVGEDAILEWIKTGRMRAVTLANGEYRLRLADEPRFDRVTDNPRIAIQPGIYKTDFWPPDLTDAELEDWARELRRKRREKRLEGLDLAGIDLTALGQGLATRLGGLLPALWTASSTDGIVAVADPGGASVSTLDLALMLGDADAAKDRVLWALLSALAILQTQIADETTKPWPDDMSKSHPGLANAGGEILETWCGCGSGPRTRRSSSLSRCTSPTS